MSMPVIRLEDENDENDESDEAECAELWMRAVAHRKRDGTIRRLTLR